MFFLTRLRRWWRDRSRYIFRYDDGNKIRYADPVEIGTALEREIPNYTDLLETLSMRMADLPPGPIRENMVQQQHDAALKLARAARKVFRLVDLDSETGWGATDAHAIRIVGQYYMYMERLARKAELFRDSPEQESASPPASATNSYVESGTAENGSN